MNRAFRLAIVGAGMVTAKSHLPAVIASPETRLVALVDPVQERASRLAKLYNLRVKLALTLADIVDDVDAVIVATPNDSHYGLVRQCIEARVPVLVEKPFTTTLDHAEKLATAAESMAVTVAVGFCTRFQENVQLVHSLLQSNWFGAVRHFVYQSGAVGGWASESGFHLERESLGGGLLVDKGVHFLDRLLYWFGYPNAVELQDDSLGGPEANAVARFYYSAAPRPFEGSVRLSKTTALPGGLVMEAEHGTLVMRESSNAPLLFRPADRPELELAIGLQDPSPDRDMDIFRQQLEDFIAACRMGTQPRVSPRQAVESIRLLRDLYAHRVPMEMSFYHSDSPEDI